MFWDLHTAVDQSTWSLEMVAVVSAFVVVPLQLHSGESFRYDCYYWHTHCLQAYFDFVDVCLNVVAYPSSLVVPSVAVKFAKAIHEIVVAAGMTTAIENAAVDR